MPDVGTAGCGDLHPARTAPRAASPRRIGAYSTRIPASLTSLPHLAISVLSRSMSGCDAPRGRDRCAPGNVSARRHRAPRPGFRGPSRAQSATCVLLARWLRCGRAEEAGGRARCQLSRAGRRARSQRRRCVGLLRPARGGHDRSAFRGDCDPRGAAGDLQALFPARFDGAPPSTRAAPKALDEAWRVS